MFYLFWSNFFGFHVINIKLINYCMYHAVFYRLSYLSFVDSNVRERGSIRGINVGVSQTVWSLPTRSGRYD